MEEIYKFCKSIFSSQFLLDRLNFHNKTQAGTGKRYSNAFFTVDTKFILLNNHVAPITFIILSPSTQ